MWWLQGRLQFRNSEDYMTGSSVDSKSGLDFKGFLRLIKCNVKKKYGEVEGQTWQFTAP